MVDALAVAASERDDCAVATVSGNKRVMRMMHCWSAKETQRERAYLAHMIDELAALKPKPDEEATLAVAAYSHAAAGRRTDGTLNEIVNLLA